MKHLNQYPVINISLKNVAGNSFEEAVVNYRHELSKFVSLNSYLLDNCDDYDRKDFLKYLNENAYRLELEWSLRNLTRIMYRHFDKYVMVLIDDYDIPLHYAYKHGYLDEMANFLTSLFGSSLKGNDYLYTGVLTGTLRIVTDIISPSFNNFKLDTVLSEYPHNCFGFAEEEVRCLLSKFDMEDKLSAFREWYGGYLFGKEEELYNPSSVMKCISDMSENNITEPKAYWRDPLRDGVIDEGIRNNLGLKQGFESILTGEKVIHRMRDHLRYERLYEDYNVYFLLISTGYLNGEVYNWERREYKLTIPNKDVRSIFESYINVYNRELMSQYSKDIGKCLTDGNLEELRKLLHGFMFDTVAFKERSIDFYIELIKGLLSDFYTITSEGNIITAENDDGTVSILIKVSENFLDLSEDADKACIELKERIDISDINAYGISFFGKNCCISKA